MAQVAWEEPSPCPTHLPPRYRARRGSWRASGRHGSASAAWRPSPLLDTLQGHPPGPFRETLAPVLSPSSRSPFPPLSLSRRLGGMSPRHHQGRGHRPPFSAPMSPGESPSSTMSIQSVNSSGSALYARHQLRLHHVHHRPSLIATTPIRPRLREIEKKFMDFEKSSSIEIKFKKFKKITNLKKITYFRTIHWSRKKEKN